MSARILGGIVGTEIVLSDDGNTVYVNDLDTGDNETFTREEFESMYGPIDDDELSRTLSNNRSDVAEETGGDFVRSNEDFGEDSAGPPEGFADDSDDGTVDERRSGYDPDDRYSSKRWQGLPLTKNFVKVTDRQRYLANLDEVFPLDVQRAYYSALLELTYAVGDVIWADKASINAYDAAVYPVQKMLSEYGLRGANLDSVVEGYMMRRTSIFNEVFAWSRVLGYLPIDGVGRERIFRFLENGNHRRWFRNRVKNLLESDGTVYDIGQLMSMRYALLRKRQSS